ncbi:MAG: 2-oxoacid:acceptor oxidoreductase family protein [Thermodesulfobacteriota bacterium]
MKEDSLQIRWHGRGGQGAITAAKIVANAAFVSGYKGVVMVPTFGTERRGAPVLTSLKLSRKKIYDLSPIKTPDMVIVLDASLMYEVDVTNGLKPGALVVVNSPRNPEDHDLGDFRVATANINSIAAEAGLPRGIVNTGIIGAFAKASGLLGKEELVDAIQEEFEGKSPEKNSRAAILAYQNTLVGENK